MAAITLAPNADKRKAAGPLNPDGRRKRREWQVKGEKGRDDRKCKKGGKKDNLQLRKCVEEICPCDKCKDIITSITSRMNLHK